MKSLDLEAVVFGDAPDLHVVGQHDDDFVAGSQQRAGGDVVSLGGANGDQDILGASAVVKTRDVGSQFRDAVHVRIVEPGAQQVFDQVGIVVQQLAYGDGMHTAFRKVVLDVLFELGHHAFHFEELKLGHCFLPFYAVFSKIRS